MNKNSMVKILTKAASWLLIAAMVVGFIPMGMVTASASDADALVAKYSEKTLADLVLEYGILNYDTINLQGGNSHMQGFCVDDKGEYMYFSYTSALVKVDMKTGEVVGSVGGFGQGSFGTPGGAHLGDLGYYDGKIYGSLEYKEPGAKFFIASFDEDYITEKGMDMKEMPVGVDGLLLQEPTEDFRAHLNDSEQILAIEGGNGYAMNESIYGHAYCCSGIDGVTFAEMPGDDSGKIYMFVAYGIYGGNAWNKANRYDNNYNIICAYDPDDFHTEASRGKALRRFTYERGLSVDVDVEGGEYLTATDKLFIWTGNTNYGAQNMDTDLDTGNIVLYTYANTKKWEGKTWPGYTIYVVDGDVAPVMKEIEVGQSAEIEDEAVKAQVLAKAESYKVDGEYPQGKHLTLECVCGKDCEAKKWADTGITAMICGAKITSTATYGIASLGDGYFLISNGKYQGRLYQRDENWKWTYMAGNSAFLQDVASDKVQSLDELDETLYSEELLEVIYANADALEALSVKEGVKVAETSAAASALNVSILNTSDKVLADAIAATEDLHETQYTSASWNAMEKALKKASAIQKKDDATAQMKYDAAMELLAAIEALTEESLSHVEPLGPSYVPVVGVESTEVEFSDVSESDWYFDEVYACVDMGLFNGTSATTFSPKAAMNRAMVWTVLARLDGVDTEGGSTWYAKGQEWAKTEGVSDGTNPTANVTREQLVTMLYRYMGSPAVEGELTFADAADVSDWAVDAMVWAVEEGLIQGKNGNKVDPQGNATRAEVAAILVRMA